MKNDLAYLTDEQLTDRYENAALRAGASNSGLVISFSAGIDRERMQECRRELLRRLAELRASQEVSNR